MYVDRGGAWRPTLAGAISARRIRPLYDTDHRRRDAHRARSESLATVRTILMLGVAPKCAIKGRVHRSAEKPGVAHRLHLVHPSARRFHGGGKRRLAVFRSIA